MQKSIRSFAIVAALALASVPSAFANQTGCNPHPQVQTASSSSTFMTYVNAVMSFFGA